MDSNKDNQAPLTDDDEPLLVVVEDQATNLSDKEKISRARHWEMLLGSIVVIALAMCIRLGQSGSIEVPIGDGWQLPPLCMSRAWFGIECPGCGLTRSFVSFADGRLAESFAFHRLGWLLASAVVLQLPYRLYELSRPAWPTPDRLKHWFSITLIAALIVNWLLKLAGL